MEKKAGVYKIHIGNGCYYIGGTNNVRRRMSEHKSRLRSGCHRNHRLQEHFNANGAEALTFEVVAYCAPERVKLFEQKLLNAYVDDPACVNYARDASAPFKGRTHKPGVMEAAKAAYRVPLEAKHLDGTVVRFESTLEAGRHFGFATRLHTSYIKRDAPLTSGRTAGWTFNRI